MQVNAEELDIDHGLVVPGESMEVVDEVAMCADEEAAPAEAPRKRRRVFSNEQSEVLNREFLEGTSRMKNADIAREISGLNGAREVSTADVRMWMVNRRQIVKARG